MKTYEDYLVLIKTPERVIAKDSWSGTKAGITKLFDSHDEAMKYCKRHKNVRWVGVGNLSKVEEYHSRCEQRREYIEALIIHDLKKEYKNLTADEFKACYSKALARSRKFSSIIRNMGLEVNKLYEPKIEKKVVSAPKKPQEKTLSPIPDEVLRAAKVILKAAKQLELDLDMA